VHRVWLLDPKYLCYRGNFINVVTLRTTIWVTVVNSGPVTNCTFCRCRTEESCHLWHINPCSGRVIQLPTSLLEDFPKLSVQFSY